MTSREEFDEWLNDGVYADYYPTEAMYIAWQARGELDAKRIAELEERHKRDSEEYHLMHVALTSANSKLAIAIEALDNCLGGDDYYNRPLITEALTKIKGE